MSQNVDLKKLDEEARLAAIKEVKNMVQRPGQLEKIDQYRKLLNSATLLRFINLGFINQVVEWLARRLVLNKC